MIKLIKRWLFGVKKVYKVEPLDTETALRIQESINWHSEYIKGKEL